MGRNPRVEDRPHFAGHALVGLAEELTPLRVADDDPADPE